MELHLPLRLGASVLASAAVWLPREKVSKKAIRATLELWIAAGLAMNPANMAKAVAVLAGVRAVAIMLRKPTYDSRPGSSLESPRDPAAEQTRTRTSRSTENPTNIWGNGGVKPVKAPPTTRSVVQSVFGKRIDDDVKDSSKIEQVFYEIVAEGSGQAGSKDGHISFKAFRKACKRLKVDLDDAEIKRVFKATAANDEYISLVEFIESVSHGQFLTILTSIVMLSGDFKVPAGYDFSKTTNDSYKNPKMEFFGEFADIRRTRDYNYHVNYTRERQAWQDHVIKSIVLRHREQSEPWIVFTCGAMGAGKGYTMRYMSSHGYFPLENVVRIDPDYIKTVMPEWNGYLTTDTYTAGSLTHRESGYIQEIAQEVALRSKQNIWVDGSLKDGDWFSLVFDDIRTRFPAYKIAIFYIYADEKVVRERIEERGKRTGRYVTEEALRRSLMAPSDSLHKLTHKSDFIARIDNSSKPLLESFEVVDRSHSWRVVQEFSKMNAAIHAFPNSLRPISVVRTELEDDDWKADGMLKVFIERAAFKDQKQLFDLLNGDCRLSLSERCKVTLDARGRKQALIPIEAKYFAFIYPSSAFKRSDMKLSDERDCESTNLGCLFLNGGYVYFDAKGVVRAVNCISRKMKKTTLQFDTPYILSKRTVRQISERKGAWNVVNERAMRAVGCKYFTWIAPGVQIDGHANRFGAFAYIFHEPAVQVAQSKTNLNRFFPIISSL